MKENFLTDYLCFKNIGKLALDGISFSQEFNVMMSVCQYEKSRIFHSLVEKARLSSTRLRDVTIFWPYKAIRGNIGAFIIPFGEVEW